MHFHMLAIASDVELRWVDRIAQCYLSHPRRDMQLRVACSLPYSSVSHSIPPFTASMDASEYTGPYILVLLVGV